MVQKLPHLFTYVNNRYKTQQICDKANLENVATLKSFFDCYKYYQKIYNIAVDNNYITDALEFVPECCKLQRIYDKTCNSYSSSIQFVPECYKSHEMCDNAFNKFFLVFIYIPERSMINQLDKSIGQRINP